MEIGEQNDSWANLVNDYEDFYAFKHQLFLRKQKFLLENSDYLSLLKKALHSDDRMVALDIVQTLEQKDLITLFPELIGLASGQHSPFDVARKLIHSLPHDWVVEHIEAAVEPFLQDGTEEEYCRFLELYKELDKNLTKRLAQRAASHTDPEIKEAGLDYLE